MATTSGGGAGVATNVVTFSGDVLAKEGAETRAGVTVGGGGVKNEPSSRVSKKSLDIWYTVNRAGNNTEIGPT